MAERGLARTVRKEYGAGIAFSVASAFAIANTAALAILGLVAALSG